MSEINSEYSNARSSNEIYDSLFSLRDNMHDDGRISLNYYKHQYNENIPLQVHIEYEDMTTTYRRSPMTGRPRSVCPTMGAPALQYQQAKLASQMDTSVEESVAKISAMFPTVGETHIKALLSKYHNREALVMSALQVEHNPVTMPGPYTPPMAIKKLPGFGFYALQTPPNTPRVSPLLQNRVQFTPRSILCNSAPRPHSPKMKLRYLKSVFPVVEETLLLDALSNTDNNIQKATERLMTLGFNKRDNTTIPQRVVSLEKRSEKDSPLPTPIPSQPQAVRVKSAEEKQQIREKLAKKYDSVTDTVITMALDCVNYEEKKASQIISRMLHDEKKMKEKKRVVDKKSSKKEKEKISAPVVQEEVKKEEKQECPDKIENKILIVEITEKENLIEINNKKTNNENLIENIEKILEPPIEDLKLSEPNYTLPWNKDKTQYKPKCLTIPFVNKAKGPNFSLVKGPNWALVKGPNWSFFKGSSIFSRFTKRDSSYGNESRGK